MKVIPSRFELVALATQRAKALAAGAPIAVSRDNDKDAVVSLREIAERKTDVRHLREMLIASCRNKIATDRFGVEKVVSVPGASAADEVSEDAAALQSSPADGLFMSEEQGALEGIYSDHDVTEEDS
jgi:DNA-directed RNA polymerase subunit omega